MTLDDALNYNAREQDQLYSALKSICIILMNMCGVHDLV